MKYTSPNLIPVGILGTGKIGTDLLVKIQRSKTLTCAMFAGRNLNSAGMQFAANLKVNLSDAGIEAFDTGDSECKIVFDATSADNHINHDRTFSRLGIFAIDMTPAKIGRSCVPSLNLKGISRHRNISMISCGGQSSIPIARMLVENVPDITAIQVRSTVSSNSIGRGTLDNIEAYYANTKAALQEFTGVEKIEVELLIDSINPNAKMLTTVKAITAFKDLSVIHQPFQSVLQTVQAYVPGYQVEFGPCLEKKGICIGLSIEGMGDYLPKYAGNLDIINCAAIAVAEEVAGSMEFNAANDLAANSMQWPELVTR